MQSVRVMEATLLQELLTMGAQDGIADITQSAHQYLDVGQNEDLVFYVDVRDVVNAVSIFFETSPTPQNSSFLPMVAPVKVTVPGLVVSRASFSTAAVPPARYVRWRLNGPPSGGWRVTFRIWCAMYSYC
ncbi:hypothetical protein BH09MYX1_BH09MYX1_58430 [soil metagenome]